MPKMFCRVKNVNGSSAYYVDGVAANASDAITGKNDQDTLDNQRGWVSAAVNRRLGAMLTLRRRYDY